MRALVLEDVNRLVMREQPIPSPGEGELLVRTKAATICTSDLIDLRRNPFGLSLPIILGHEGAGVVEAIGPGVVGFQPGDEVGAHPVIPCGHCAACLRGLGHLCDDMRHLGFNIGGVFADYFCIRHDRVRKKSAALPFSYASLIEPVAVCLEAVKRGNVSPGQTVLVVGDGPYGVMMCRLCEAIGGVRTIILGRHDFRMAQAANAAAVSAKKANNALADIMRLTNNQGVDTAILCVGTGEALDIAVESLKARGTLSVFSAIHGKPPVDMLKVSIKELNILGSCNDADCMDEALDYLTRGVMDGLVTHEFPFEEWEKAIAMAENGKDEALKVSLVW